MIRTVNILGIAFSKLTLQETINLIRDKINNHNNKLLHIITVNPEIAVQIQEDNELMEISKKADLLTPDGVGIVWASRILRNPVAERVTGYDLLLESLKQGNLYNWSFYFLGSDEEVNRNMEVHVSKFYPNIRISGRHHGYFNTEDEEEIVQEIEYLCPDILIVAFGSPRTDKWIEKHRKRISAKVVFGVGGSMDVITGKIPKTPEIWKKFNLEWLYRRIIMPERKDRQKKLKIFAIKVIKQALGFS
jgi:N-acetylglucosaminyldiphosphoundecaprenol N-acetyl-beta-D-mannosaminyltransferase